MAGFALPRLRWLLIGAFAAGAWAMTQEPPARQHWQKAAETQREPAASKPVEPVRSTSRDNDVKQGRVVAATPRPAPESAIPQPAPATYHTTERVRLRSKATTSSEVVTLLKGDQTLTVLRSDGEWKEVQVGKERGFVHASYLAPGKAKPKSESASTDSETVAGIVPAPVSRPSVDVSAQPVSVSEAEGPWSTYKPMRAPQQSDCQCPYDLMLNGKQCGDRSAYAKGRGVECYF